MSATVASRRPALPSIGVLRLLKTSRFARLASLAAFLIGWQVVVPLLPTVLVPSLSEVANFMWDEIRLDTLAPQNVYQSFAISLQRLAVGFGIAVAIGVPVGLVMGLSKAAESFLHDFVVVGLAMPSLVWALIAAMWFGFGNTAPLVTVVLASVTFIIINVAEGVRAVPKDLIDMGKAYDAGRTKSVRHIVFPSLMPFFFASMRYGLANGWKGLVLAEVYAATNGAGWMIRFWYDAHRAQGVIGYALFFMLFALVLERLVFGRLSAWVFRWRPQPGVEPEPAVARIERHTSGDH